jgi:hypothetical protein
VRVGTWLLGTTSLLAAYSPAALGQESLSEPPAMSSPASSTLVKKGDPAEESDTVTKKRRFLGRLVGPQSVTPEQREEAEHLRQLTAKYGTDPTAIVNRVQLSSRYFDHPQSASSILTVAPC